MASTFDLAADEFLTCEIHSESTLPLLSYFIYISGYGETLTYYRFNELLQAKDSKLLSLFPGLRECEKGKTCDKLFTDAVRKVVDDFWDAYDEAADEISFPEKIQAGWTEDAINLYDLGNAHVVFENGFIESFKDAFLSSNEGGEQAGMKQLQEGMDAIPNAIVSSERGEKSLVDDIIYGARVTEIGIPEQSDPQIPRQAPAKVTYEVTANSLKKSITSDYLILAIPYTAQRTVAKSKPFVPMQEMAVRDVRDVKVTKILLQYKKRWWEKVFTEAGQGLDGGLVSDLPIRYTMFPKTEDNTQFKHSNRGAIMAAYTFEQDATILGSFSPDRRIQIAAENLNRIFPSANAFCYFGPMQKTKFLDTMQKPDWENRIFFAGEQASFTHGWIQGAFEAGLRCVQQMWSVAIEGKAQ
nr:hypothetical protein FVER53263_00096 [Fusarium verticillioides]